MEFVYPFIGHEASASAPSFVDPWPIRQAGKPSCAFVPLQVPTDVPSPTFEARVFVEKELGENRCIHGATLAASVKVLGFLVFRVVGFRALVVV